MQHYSVGHSSHFTLRNKKKKEIRKNFGMVRVQMVKRMRARRGAFVRGEEEECTPTDCDFFKAAI